MNESIHRMVVWRDIFENYNSEITRHIDLPTNEGLKNTSSHLPSNLFADNTLVKGGDSPVTIYEDLQEDPFRSSFAINSNALINEARQIIDYLNDNRNKLDQIFSENDLNTFGNVASIYEDLEESVIFYDKIRSNVKIFERLIKDYYYNIVIPEEEKQVYTALADLHFDIKKITRQVRNENQSEVNNGISKIEKEISWVQTCILKINNPEQRSELNAVMVSINKIVKAFKDYVNGVPPPNLYRGLGRGYYYHNYEILTKINQYGSGYVWKLEEFFKKHDWDVINFFEEPHFLKVIYADRIPLEMLRNPAIDPNALIRELETNVALPVIENIVVEKNTPQEVVEEEPPEEINYTVLEAVNLQVDTSHFILYLQDHLRPDGDRISINVNGQWIHRQIFLPHKSMPLELSIDPTKENTVIIRADNEGWMPPNTIVIKYISKNGEADFFMKKDLSTSEAIQIQYSN